MSNLCQIDQFFLIRFHIISNMMFDVCIYFSLFCKFVIQVQKLRKYIKIYQFSFNLSFSNCKRSKDSLEKKKLSLIFMLNTHLRNQILKSLYQKSTPNLLETRQMLIKKTYTSGIFYLLYPSRSLVFYKVERNMLLDQTTFGGVEARILLFSSLRQVFEEPTYFRIPIGAVL